MKLRAITLTEVRQFHGSVRVSGIGDGVNVLAEPNESGKSTLFDALHYLFFVKHTAQVGSKGFTLQPAAGGDPQVEAEVEVDGTLLTLRKKWGRGRTAEVWRNGVSIALRDEAEAFIAALTAPPDAGGPAGLLWVRQGVTEFDGKDDKARRSRADLMSSVTGEFEALTGGKRMDRARARAQDELDVLVSSRAARRGGPLDLAERAVTELSEAVGTLTRRAAELQGALQERRQVRRTLAELQDPDEAARRREGLARADAALAAAEQHALKVVAAASARESAALALAAVRKDIAERTRVATAVDTLTRRLTEAKSAAEDASARAGVLDAAVTTAEERLQAAVDLREAADKAVSVALTAETRREEAARRQRLTEALDAAQALAARLPALRAAAATGPDARQLDAIDAASRDLAIAEALARQSAPQLSFDARPGIVLSLNGSPLDATPRPVPE
ncbi:MAG: chromosome segregation protein SMC, partial [Rhodobacteraceae bacterium]|nr:chromosome segregation protein SMC [Paracoccaceae bacterium]